MVDGAEGEEARRAVAVEEGALGVAAREELQAELVLPEGSVEVLLAEEPIPFLLQLVGALQEQGGIGIGGGGGCGGSGGG